MGFLDDLKNHIMQQLGLTSQQPVAYTRFTRTPIYSGNDLPSGVLGQFNPPTNSIKVDPQFLGKIYDSSNSNTLPPLDLQTSNPGGRVIAHEQIHSLIEPELNKLSGYTDDYIDHIRKQLQRLYPTAPNSNLISEGLAFSTANTYESPIAQDSNYWDWVNKSLNKMDPKVRVMFQRILDPTGRKALGNAK